MVVIPAIVILGCAGDSDQAGDSKQESGQKTLSHVYEKLGPFQGWQKQRFDNVVFIYSPEHANLEELKDYAKVFSALTRQTASFLQIEPPDSLTIYFYPDAKHGITVTGFFAPFAEGEVIHFWLPSQIGQPIAKLLIPIWSNKEPKHRFLKHGIIALLDGSGENYHVRTMKYVDSGQFVPLKKLAVDTSVDADRERYRSAMAASFVDYLVFDYGIFFFKELYESDSTFDSEVERIFKLPVDSLEKKWLEVVRRVVSEK